MDFFLIIMAGGGHILRQKPSTAYWVLGEITDGNINTFYLSSPDGEVQHPIAQIHNTTKLSLLEWLPNTTAFLYASQSEDGEGEEIHAFSLKTRQSTLLSRHYFPTDPRIDPFEDMINKIPGRNELTIMLRPDQSAIFLLDEYGTIIRQLTPDDTFYDIHSTVYLTHDNETLLFTAATIDREARYHLNLRTGHITELTTFPAPNRAIEGFTMTSNRIGPYIAIIELNSFTTEFFQANIETGQFDHRLSIPYTSKVPDLYYPPSDGHDIIFSINDNPNAPEEVHQLQLNLETGELDAVSFGLNLKFSSYYDANWQEESIFLAGIALVIFGLGWSTLDFRRYRRSSCRHP